MQDQLQQLKAFISAMSPLPDDDLSQFAGLWKPRSAKRKEILTAAGEREKHLYFVLSGVQRVYTLMKKDAKRPWYLPMRHRSAAYWMRCWKTGLRNIFMKR
ncbi:hypothetical protein [Mucilaginibacter gynuensis]|uniref:hypothetical protein n=1 Tax=Mucilaginibacter gynuensis TaxID=1302236 RepID=UPI0031F0CC4E